MRQSPDRYRVSCMRWIEEEEGEKEEGEKEEGDDERCRIKIISPD